MEDYRKDLVKKLTAIGLFRFHYSKVISQKVGIYSGQFPVLNYIYLHPNCQQIDIAKELQVSSSSIATSLKRLEKSGFIKRQVDKDNQRAKILNITDKGKKSIEDGKAEFDKLDSVQFKNFTQKELNELGEYLNRIIYNLCGEKDFTFEHLLDIAKCFFSKEEKE